VQLWGYYGGQGIGSALGMQNVAGTQAFTNTMMSPFQNMSAVKTANTLTPGSPADYAAQMDFATGTNATGGGGGFMDSITGFAKKNPGATLGAANRTRCISIRNVSTRAIQESTIHLQFKLS
jgi:hypothetical protein